MMLKYSDVYAALYRVTDMYSPLFRVVSVRTRYVWHGVFQDDVALSDVFSVGASSIYSEFAESSDSFSLAVLPRYFDGGLVSDSLAVKSLACFRDVGAAFDTQVLSVSFGVSESLQALESFFGELMLFLADSVGVNDEFSFGGDFNTAVGNASFASDKVRVSSSVECREISQVSDQVRVGSRLRHGLYIGGAALGATAIGGRLK